MEIFGGYTMFSGAYPDPVWHAFAMLELLVYTPQPFHQAFVAAAACVTGPLPGPELLPGLESAVLHHLLVVSLACSPGRTPLAGLVGGF